MIDWGLLAWPANAWLLCAFVAALAVMSAFRRRVRLFAWLGGRACALWSIGCALAVTVALGLVPQSRASGGDWWQHLVSSWPFALAWAWLALSLGMATIRVVLERKPPVGARQWLHTIIFVLNHLGLLLALVAATLGSADMQRVRMAVGRGEPQSVAWDSKGNPRPLDIAIELLDFKIDENPSDGMPRKFAARVNIIDVELHAPALSEQVIEVNRPATAQGWKVYLIAYEADLGEDTRYCELELVRDPWLPWVYAGIAMMLAGAAGLFIFSPQKTVKQ